MLRWYSGLALTRLRLQATQPSFDFGCGLRADIVREILHDVVPQP